MFDKELRIDAGIPVNEALNAVGVYIRDLDVYPWKKDKHGVGSGTMFVFDGGLALFVYLTKTCYIVRRG